MFGKVRSVFCANLASVLLGLVQPRGDDSALGPRLTPATFHTACLTRPRPPQHPHNMIPLPLGSMKRLLIVLLGGILCSFRRHHAVWNCHSDNGSASSSAGMFFSSNLSTQEISTNRSMQLTVNGSYGYSTMSLR